MEDGRAITLFILTLLKFYKYNKQNEVSPCAKQPKVLCLPRKFAFYLFFNMYIMKTCANANNNKSKTK
jgi:hypothetical protein